MPKAGFRSVVPAGRQVLVFTFVGKIAQEVNIGNQPNVSVILKDSVIGLEDVIVVGYGRQKRESVVAAVSQTTGAVLERAGGVSNIGAALTGNVPGLITAQSTGLPGEEDPQIIIRGRSTWNSSSPLVLVDGVERPMTSVGYRFGRIDNCFKRRLGYGRIWFARRQRRYSYSPSAAKRGKASIRATVNTVVKSPSKLPGKADSYESLRTINDAIEYEVALKPESWNQYTPLDIINKYEYPANLEEAERYPNVDWAKTLFKDYARSQNANLNISGGTRFVKYFHQCRLPV